MNTLLMIKSGIRPTVSINKPDSMEANNWTKPTATAPPNEFQMEKIIIPRFEWIV